ncbi:MAG: hypothetical protein WA609_12000 [Terriglobales bacterium]
MGIRPRKSVIEFAPFARFCAAGGTTDTQSFFRFGLHDRIVQDCAQQSWSIVIGFTPGVGLRQLPPFKNQDVSYLAQTRPRRAVIVVVLSVSMELRTLIRSFDSQVA